MGGKYMITANATISDVIVDKSKVWIQFEIEGKYFPVHYEFNISLLSDFTRLIFIQKRTKTKNTNDLVGKEIRVIDTEASVNSLVAIGDNKKNKFVSLYGSEFPTREEKIYRKYRQ